MNSVAYVFLHLICRGTFQIYLPGKRVHAPIRIILVAYLSATTIVNYNQLAPMYTPKLQLIKHMDPTLNFGIIEVDQII